MSVLSRFDQSNSLSFPPLSRYIQLKLHAEGDGVAAFEVSKYQPSSIKGLLHFPTSDMEFRRFDRVLGSEVIIVYQVLRYQVVSLQALESPEERAQGDANLTIGKATE